MDRPGARTWIVMAAATAGIVLVLVLGLPAYRATSGGGCDERELEAWPKLRGELELDQRAYGAREMIRTHCPGGLGAAQRQSLDNRGLWREGRDSTFSPLEHARDEWSILCPPSFFERADPNFTSIEAYDECGSSAWAYSERDELNPLVVPSIMWSLLDRLEREGVSHEAALALTRDICLRDVALETRLDGIGPVELPRSTARHAYSLDWNGGFPAAALDGDSVERVYFVLRRQEWRENRAPEQMKPAELHVLASAGKPAAEVVQIVTERLQRDDADDIEIVGIVTATEHDTRPLALVRVHRSRLQARSGTWQDFVAQLEQQGTGCIDWQPWVDVLAQGYEDWSDAPPCEYAAPRDAAGSGAGRQ
ncbi:MAG: hypothetical protein HC927_02930 [Deltaproteobacteria bacterium]|nr:hypothetical protein [Deltaproteobacteria bacterium]